MGEAGTCPSGKRHSRREHKLQKAEPQIVLVVDRHRRKKVGGVPGKSQAARGSTRRNASTATTRPLPALVAARSSLLTMVALIVCFRLRGVTEAAERARHGVTRVAPRATLVTPSVHGTTPPDGAFCRFGNSAN